MRWWFAWLIVLAGCTDFDAVPRGVCGNGLLEPGEDCDSDDAACVRCAVACAVDAQCPAAAYACGVDGFCHAPGGQLAAPTAPVTFAAEDLRVTDIDRDGRGDVVGVSSTSIVVRYGDAAGALAQSDSFVTPAQTGPAAFGDLDGDGSIDLSLATPDGVVSYTSPFGSLSPVDIETPLYDDRGAPLDLRTLVALGPTQFAAFVVDDQATIVMLAVFDFARPQASSFVAPCGARLGPLSPSQVDPSRADLYRVRTVGTETFVLAFTTAGGLACALSVHATATGFAVTDITPLEIAPLAQRPVLADLEGDADPCPALVNADGGPAALRQWDGELVNGRCTLKAAGPTGTALPAIENAPGTATAVGHVPIDPPIPFFARDAIVLSSGVYAHLPGIGMGAVYQSSRRIARVAHGDLDRDGDIDAVLAPAEEDDLDALYRYPEGLELLRFDTASRVTSLTLGDFDGNAFTDLAYTEAAADHQKMLIAYGTADRPLPPVQVATFAAVASVAVLAFPDSVDRLSIADDLFVVQPARDGHAPTATVLHGSPQRTMLSFFDPRADEARDATLVRGAVIGNFVDASPEPDLLVLAEDAAAGMRGWRVTGGADGLDPTPSAGMSAAGIAACAGGAGTAVCAADALYLAWPRAEGVVFALDRRASRATRLAVTATAITATEPAPLLAGLPAGVGGRALHAADLDGDGAPELIAAFASSPGAAVAGAVRSCRVAAGTVEACEDVTPAIARIAPMIEACIDAAPARLDGAAPTTDLVVLCREAGTASALFRVARGDAGLVATELARGTALRALRVADVTGDRVDDVVAIQGDGGASSLIVFPQCSSRELASCRGAAARSPGGAP